ncbi:MAG TPA: hypothetical protein VD996_02775 [Chitinophagaceae bacterium]|nr:hypothetical protein [Chitinophagaceae bacterium]
MKIAYIVYRDNGPFSFADKEHDSLLQFLQDKRLDIHLEAWADETVDWKKYQCIVLKSPWDYVDKPQQFYTWLNYIKQLGVTLLNPANIVQWNCDKHYLREIAHAGLRIIPTYYLEQGDTFSADTFFEQLQTSKIIVKPCISGASKNTFLITTNDTSATSAINQLLQNEAMMVQAFLPQINEGEWSLLFFNGKFSHALIKIPNQQDFRSQPQYGSTVLSIDPGKEVLQTAQAYVDRFAKDCLYARVDGLMIDNEFHLMELELIDPYLFLDTTNGGEENYYEALKELLLVLPQRT